MSFYITGDTHGEIGRFSDEALSLLGRDDYLFVCGDFGFVFYPRETAEYIRQQKELDRLSEMPYTICFVDGNHENFELLKEYPTEYRFGGKVQRIRNNVIHLMRGQVYTIDGKKILTMGGAYSTDKDTRLEGYSWWSEELPSNDEYREATANLRDAGNQVDLILTHTAPREAIRLMGRYPDMHDAELTGFLEWIMYEVTFGKWVFGHWHTDKEVLPHMRAVYYDVIREDA